MDKSLTSNTEARLLSILIPVYNERAYLRPCLEKVMAAPLPDGLEREIILVDDGSTDGTAALVDDLAAQHARVVRAFHQPHNQGKGAAIRRAIFEMRGQYAIFQDADLEYDPNEYGRLLRPILDGYADVVYGSRFAASPMRRVLNYHHALGNMFLTHLSNAFTGLNLTDMETCYKVFRADLLKTIPLRSNRFGIEPEITAKIAKRGSIVYEVPISYHGRGYAEGKKIGWKDGFSALYRIVKYWLIDDCFDERYGHSILASISKARKLNQWMTSVIEPYLGQRILEIGSGIGNVSRFLPKREHLILSDVDDEYLQLLRDTFRDNDLVSVCRLDLTSDESFASFALPRPDTIICLNVLEHLEDDLVALARMHGLLAPGGRLILLVPQHPWLYGSYDEYLGHLRRYTGSRLSGLLGRAGFHVIASRGFNVIGILGWWFNSCLLHRQRMSKFQLKIFDTMVPLLRILDPLVPGLGLSLICVAEKKGGVPARRCCHWPQKR